jgi:chemotaxis protein methyltransferase CheR
MRNEQVEEVEISLFLDAVKARYGYDFRDYAPSSIRRRVRAVLAKSGLENLGELQHRMLHNPQAFAWIVGTLTVQVTELFRDPDFYRAFRDRVVPVLKTYPQIKVWNAGCATGEEAYSLAVLMADEGLVERVQIYATDLSASALDRAREGVYPEAQLESFSNAYVAAGGREPFASFYVRKYGNVTFSEALRKHIVFFQHDLTSDHSLGEMQVIFCRNVLIYFNAALRERVLQTFGAALCHRGFLCLGRNEGLPVEAPLGFETYVKEQRIYRYEGA